ncbi:hypothetical protein AMS68_006335 [Peltaster fructicola]|uniref:Nuclear speckle splicing regulatory protein 1 N-terminal domain-containing protein n=1 Tax=Peltaster fructicola TaxID=286661 RepID=A0A6H0Y1T9_9PEZI|nr:hypothetical protein AMS68_006335 [Peltaster fructicola]
MPLKFGLNVKKAEPIKKSIWDEPELDDDDQPAAEDDVAPVRGPPKKFGSNVPSKGAAGPPTRLKNANVTDNGQNASSLYNANKQIKAAEEADAAIFDYDTFLDAKNELKEARKEVARQEAVERKPKYINNLLDAAARRKQDQLVAQEKLLQRERETEGDEFADKEKFVTGAYKQQQEETRRVQEEDRARAEADDERRRRQGGGMQSFYRSVMDQTEKSHQEAVEAAARYDKSKSSATTDEVTKNDADLAAEMKAKGVTVHVNEEGQLVDKRQLLTAGLNIAPSGQGKGASGSDHLKTSARAQPAFKRDYASDRAQGERQRKLIEEQIESSAKRKREEEEEQRAQQERDAKSKKTDKDPEDETPLSNIFKDVDCAFSHAEPTAPRQSSDSKKLVRESLVAGSEPDHDAILVALQQEIDKHNSIASDAEDHIRKRRRRRERHNAEKASSSGRRFRFKDGTTTREKHSKQRRTRHRQPSEEHSTEAAHPFPREPAPPNPPTDDAFLSSLLDALADDEAAAYWESVYSQPIHAFSRPTIRTAKGELEEMSDDQYAAWVKEKMWEKQHPEVVIERDRAARKQQEEEYAKQKKKDDFVRRREKEAWERASEYKTTEDYEYVFDHQSSHNTTESSIPSTRWHDAWIEYLAAWEKLNDEGTADTSQLPRPTLPSKPLTRPHIEEFMQNMPLQSGQTRQHVLKVERVRWHPDKIQQRFRGKADDDTMKTVTNIFQIIDAIWTDGISSRS